MENKALGIQAIVDRLEEVFQTWPLKYLEVCPDSQVNQDKLPAVIVLEGDDDVVKRSMRGYLGYPCVREAELVVECWETDLGRVRDLFRTVRRAVFGQDPVLCDGVSIRELKMFGPFSLGIPGVKGLRLVLGMIYEDTGL